MQKPQIHWRYQNPSRKSLKRGWTQLSRNIKLALITFSLVYLTFSIYASLKQQSAFSLVFCLLSTSSLTLSILHINGAPKAQLVSLIKELKIKDGSLWIGVYPLPDTVRKVVIGRVDIQGPAFLQLAWNQGHQWLFPLEELQQVRHFFREYAPQIEIVNE